MISLIRKLFYKQNFKRLKEVNYEEEKTDWFVKKIKECETKEKEKKKYVIYAKRNPEKFLYIKKIKNGYKLFNRINSEVGKIMSSPTSIRHYDLRDLNYLLGQKLTMSNLNYYDITQIY